ncbi:RNA polymerase sigma-70 factor [Lacibacter sediminis]|uniref:RNA polymerase sigma-70 factor n=1 Tax=Lacibacter sediminis TaxID=2760713 RepID=A0A7G5XLX8_9BACT|nr:RNA polymerase sigma-70 factor [Lacibacter sediminis]QNA46481.1 RNA polymerase sigma-70 factor [Lacibacter sediminis]
MEVIKDLQRQFATNADMRAYKELYMLLFDGLHRFSYSLVKSREGAEEIVSDVFIKLWQIRNELHHIDNLKGYLYTVARNLSLNYLEKKSRNPVGHLNDIDVEKVIEFNSPEDLFISNETIKGIEQVVHRLPAQCKMVFHLVREEGLKYKEVATELNISVFTVRNQMTIATRKIGEALSQRISNRMGLEISNLIPVDQMKKTS